jgi:hypothetical protein
MRYILIALLIASCSPKARFTRLITKHPELLTVDTLVIRDTITLYVPEVHTDTVVTIKELTDTITITKDRVTVKAWYVPKEKKVYIQGKCDPVYVTKIVERKVPVKYYEKYPWWKKLLNNLLAIFIIFALFYALHRVIKKLV